MFDIHATRKCPHGKLFDDYCEPCELEEAEEYFAETGHYPTCGPHEGTQRGPCTCQQIHAQRREASRL
jgi:hypothetical protein